MSLCHLYFKTTVSHHIEKILGSFENSISLDFNGLKSLDDFDVYLVELEEPTKESSLQLRALFKSKEYPLIYFIVPKKYNLMFFQLSYLLSVTDLLTHNQDTNKIIEKITADKESHVESTLEVLLGRENITTENFIFYKNMQLKQVSPNLLKNLGCENLTSFEKSILNQVDIDKLLNNDTSLNTDILDTKNSTHNFTLKSVGMTDNYRLIYFTGNTSAMEKDLPFISSRVTFVELLKEKYIQKTIVENELSAITLNIKNTEEIKDKLSSVELEYLLIDFLSFMESILDKKIIFAEMERNFFIVLFENIAYEETNTIAENFHVNVLNYIADQEFKPFVDIYTFNLNTFEFNEILATFENIQNQNLTYEERTSYYIKHTSNTQNVINEKTLLDDTFKYKTEFKILNIYNGLVIKTPSKIVKVTQDTIYIQFEALQGVVLNLEKQTVLQSSSFMQDIQAHVKIIDLKKRVAVLENFKFLQTNANSRKYSRVTMSNKTPISVRLKGASITGFIIDLSIKSIAVKTKHSPNIDTIKSQEAVLTFNIPNAKAEDGYFRLELETTIIATTIPDTDNNCKVICDLDEAACDTSKLMEFIYERQKALIIELRKTSKLN